jgi:hypothetical protein
VNAWAEAAEDWIKRRKIVGMHTRTAFTNSLYPSSDTLKASWSLAGGNAPGKGQKNIMHPGRGAG